MTVVDVTEDQAGVMLRAVLDANRDLYRQLEQERQTVAELRRKAHRLQTELHRARADRDLWRCRAERCA